jgi:hypothetical protein
MRPEVRITPGEKVYHRSIDARFLPFSTGSFELYSLGVNDGDKLVGGDFDDGKGDNSFELSVV